MQPFELRGDGVLLAIPTVDDIDRITECCQDPEIQKWIGSIPSPFARSDAEQFVNDIVPSGWGDDSSLTWAVRDPEDRLVLGMIGLRLHDAGLATVGFWLASDARGQKIMSRAVRLVAEYAFDPSGLGLTYLQWYALVGNWASRRVAWATGFVFDGKVRAWLSNRGERSDAWLATLKAGESMEPKTPWYEVPEIRGENFTLRPFVPDDADAVIEACSDPVTQYWLSALPSPYTRDDALRFIETRRTEPAEGKAVHWAATPHDGGPARGGFSLMRLDTRNSGAEIGYWVHPEARGKGMATEAVAMMLRHAFIAEEDGGLGLRRVVVAHVVGNDASRVPIERNGFKPIGLERAEHQFRDGSIADLQWYDLLFDEFRS